ncbi:MAG: hypothetical protein ACRDCE_11870 [Cetobacterium sp.]|uniref:hypothetical protein n=1 Tax=Cetobacterium sp. TaxID=2071632 RepID=UPI003EE7C8B8
MSLASLFGLGQETKNTGGLTGVHLIDFSQIVISTIVNTFEPTDNLPLEMVRHACLNTLRSNVSKNKQMYPTTVVCIDAKDGYWRRDVAYYYKRNRAKSREESEWNWEEIFKHMNTVVREVEEFLPYITIDLSKTEADDTIGVLTKYVSEKYPDCKILITSADGDFTQLHKFKNVKQWSPLLKKWVSCKHGSPRNDLRYKIMKGDKKDGIAGIKSPSDYYLVRNDGERAPSISTKKLLEPVFKLDDPCDSDLMTEEEKKRYKENEILLDFEMVPDNIRAAIIDKFENFKVPPRSGLFAYFVSRKLPKLSTETGDF